VFCHDNAIPPTALFSEVFMKYCSILLLALTLAACSGNNGSDISSSGTIEGTDVNIGTEVTGKVREVRVDEGSRVAVGDTLITLDDTEYRIQLRQSVANLASFESAYRLAVEGSRKEDIVGAEAAFKAAEDDYGRMKSLLVSGTVTQKQYDDAYTRYVSAQQTYEKLKAGSRPEEIEGARQKRDLAAAQVDLLKKGIRDCSITAPSAGTVSLRAVEPGELVTVGMNVLRITYLDKVKLTIYVNEQDLGRVRLGLKASVTIDSDPKKSFEGTVTYISPTAEFTPKNVQTKEERTKLVFGVKIEVNNPDGALKPGLPADATLLNTGTR
jgi:HlyD family secretion protein